jgi:hypothetical protein
MTAPIGAAITTTPPITLQYAFPQSSQAMSQSSIATGATGICTLTHQGRAFRFRTNPNEFNWDYTLNKRVDQTYGGRVVQLLGCKIDNFTFKVDCGAGGWAYANSVANFLKDVMIDQRNGIPATFEYTTRGWKFNCYVVSVPYSDAVEEVLRTLEINLKVQEDVSGVMSSASLWAELQSLQDGINFQRSKYNDPQKQGAAANQPSPDQQFSGVTAVEEAIQGAASILGYGAAAGAGSYISNLTGLNPGALNTAGQGNTADSSIPGVANG